MDVDLEETVNDVKRTDSQKSVATSNVYSLDFTDSSSGKHSSGKDTYVLEWDDSEDSEPASMNTNKSAINLEIVPAKPKNVNGIVQEGTRKIDQASSTSFGKCSIIAQEIYTQTSKTIIQLAENEISTNKNNTNTLETQTSIISITENKTLNYTIEISACNNTFSRNESNGSVNELPSITFNPILNNSLEDRSSKFTVSETDNELSEDIISENDVDDKIINIIDAECSDDHTEINFEHSSDFEISISDTTDIEEDSLECNKYDKLSLNATPKSVDEDVSELYSKLTGSIELHTLQRHSEPENRRFETLTPLTEESLAKRDSIVDLTPNVNNISNDCDQDRDVLFTNAGIKVKMLANDTGPDSFKLPPIQTNSALSSPNLNSVFLAGPKHFNRPDTLPCVFENHRDKVLDRWEIGNKELAAGESPLISGRSGKSDQNNLVHDNFQLPPIHVEGYVVHDHKPESRMSSASQMKSTRSLSGSQQLPISIKDKIKELKMSEKNKNQWNNYKNSFDVADTMANMPQTLDKFWGVISEQRIADLIRQVSTHVESPRTQVARTACTTLAAILKNTNYTKKPDFHEAMSILLTKTGSFSRPVRRAANVALDDIVCAVELTQSITALCIYGACHKSPLVRCASARLLVVCCALGGGGRDLLRARPPSAVTARKHALRCLAALLDDRNADARKYAERLYSMLRPLPHFEAYYLTDVDVELASRQMKKYDQLLLCGPSNETR